MKPPANDTLKANRIARGKRPQFYPTAGLDQAMSMILVLAEELTVMRDRLDTVERVAATKGVMLEADIEAYVPDEPVLAAREQRRQEFLARLYYLMRKEAAELGSEDSAERYTKALADIAEG
jgi:hypothetical protein